MLRKNPPLNFLIVSQKKIVEVGSWQLAVSSGQSVVGSQQWAVSSGQSAVGSQQWAGGVRQWAMELRIYGI